MRVLREFQNDEDALEDAKFAVNLMLEIFGRAEILQKDLVPWLPIKPPKRLNWEVLPTGEHPWQSLRPAVRDVLQSKGPRSQPVFEERWRTILSYEPSFTAVGRAGFSGYLIFGFPERSLYVLESAYYGNATYVLDRDWESLSTLTKAELIHDSLHRDRIPHRQGWALRIQRLLGSQGRRVS